MSRRAMSGQLRCLLVLCVCWSSMMIVGQTPQTTPSSTDQFAIFQAHARAALAPTGQPTTVSMNGTFVSTEGSLRQEGGVQLSAKSDGSFAINLSRNQGKTNETRNITDAGPNCSWTDQTGKTYSVALDNCFVPAWFFPGLSLLLGNGSASEWQPSSLSSDASGYHLRFQYATGTSHTNNTLVSAGNVDLLLASDTYLPITASFGMRPDKAVNATVQFRVTYSDYRNVAGVLLPYHIQQFINGSLTLDIHINDTSIQ
jgi:hypothetical protein